jgi:hypothetical protein
LAIFRASASARRPVREDHRGPSNEIARRRQPLLLAAGDVWIHGRSGGCERYLSEGFKARLKPTSDTGGIAAIDSGEQTPRINLKATNPRGTAPSSPAGARGSADHH